MRFSLSFDFTILFKGNTSAISIYAVLKMFCLVCIQVSFRALIIFMVINVRGLTKRILSMIRTFVDQSFGYNLNVTFAVSCCCKRVLSPVHGA